jgi:hypothetical protein
LRGVRPRGQVAAVSLGLPAALSNALTPEEVRRRRQEFDRQKEIIENIRMSTK